MSTGMGTFRAIRNRRALFRTLSPAIALTAALFCLSPVGLGQAAGVNQGGSPYIHAQAGADPAAQKSTPQPPSTLDQMRQNERHRRVVSDTAKLLQLSSELKAEIDQTPNDQLSVEMVRKAAEIEKLAHDLKGWMTY